MKRLAVLLVVLAMSMQAGICMAAESQRLSTSPQGVMVDRNGDSRIDGVDIYDESGNVVKRGYDDNDDMMVDRWETYDENTGLPIVTESDADFLLQ